ARKAQQLVRRARRSLERAAPPFGEDLHDTRTALKRARALLQLVPKGKKPREQLGKLGRRVGQVRDAGVAVVTFDRVVKSEGLRMTPALRTVRAHLVERRDGIENDPGTVRALAKAERSLERHGRALKKLEAPAWTTVKRGCKASYRNAQRAMVAAYESGSDEAFHDWRKALKQHLYQLKGLKLGSGAEGEQRLVGLDQLGEVLGEAQDLAVFESILRAQGRCFSSPRDPARLCELLQRRRTQLRNRVRAQAEELFAERPAAYAAGL
ncbi:MAG TPA: CHAD domain-containing protein, partial [Polyangia bacterium]